MTAAATKIWPVILSGGAGSRLWPLSRAAMPKQLLPLAGAETMIQATAARAGDPARFHRPIVVAGKDHGDLIAAGLAASGTPAETIILEPAGRNTAPAVALAAHWLAGRDPDAVMLVMPSDHVVLDTASFDRAVAAALPLAEAGWLVTFGIAPAGPETGYGYIQTGDALADGAHQVKRFVEKPDLETAKGYLAGGDYAWNAGIFLFSAARLIDALRTQAPAIWGTTAAAIEDGATEGAVFMPQREAFLACPSDSIDYAVMEKDARVAVVPVDMGWSDVGSWSSLKAVSGSDAQGNVIGGDVLAIDTNHCLLRSEGPMLATIGVENLTVVATHDAVLVVSMDRAQDVKKVVDSLAARGRREHLDTPRVVHTWGIERVAVRGDAAIVSELTLEPGQALPPRVADQVILASGEIEVDGRGVAAGETRALSAPYCAVNKSDSPARLVELRFPR